MTDDYKNRIEKLKQLIEKADRIVFFGGAGVSTESGVKDYRSEDGLYNTVREYGVSPETILSHSFMFGHSDVFYDFYYKYFLADKVDPNAAHYSLAKLEEQGKLTAVITQNIDGLHQAAGSKTVLELHGSVLRNFCESCGKFHDVYAVKNSADVPKCECGGGIKPDVVLYEEGLNQKTIQDSVNFIANADVLIIGGTSLAVYPAAGLIDYYRGNKLVLVNKTPTPRDGQADLIVQGNIGEIFATL